MVGVNDNNSLYFYSDNNKFNYNIIAVGKQYYYIKSS